MGAPGLAHVLPALARVALEHAPVAAGVAVVENGRGELATVEGVAPEGFFPADARLLRRAKAMRPEIPFPRIDVLVVERIGKDVSGVGMDVHVTGRTGIPGIADPARPRVARIVVLALTEATAGNGLGIGLATSPRAPSSSRSTFRRCTRTRSPRPSSSGRAFRSWRPTSAPP